MKNIPRFLFPLLVIMFAVVLPLILAYAAGYRFDPKSGTVTQLGLIIIDGKPKNTRVYVGDSFRGETLPLKLKGVHPNFYSLKLESDGYHTLTLRRELRSGETLVISPVFLLKDSTPTPVRTGTVSGVYTHNDRSTFFVVIENGDSKHMWKFVPATDEWVELYRTDRLTDWRVSLNADASVVLISFDDTHRLVWADGSRVRTLHADTPTWSRSDARRLYFVDATGAFVSESVGGGQQQVRARNTKHILTLSADHAWIVRSVNEVDQLVSYALSSGDMIFVDSWDQSRPSILPVGDIPLLVHEQEIHRAFPDRLQAIGPYDQHTIVWERERNSVRALVYNTFDIGLLTNENNRIRTITRFAGDVRAVSPVFGTEYVLISRGSDVIAIHTGSSDRAYTTLLENARIDSIVSNERGTGAYLAGTIGTQSGLFFLALRDE